MSHCCGNNGLGPAIILVLFILLIIIVGAFIQSFKKVKEGLIMNCCKKNTPENPCCNNGINTAFIVIVLFILLAIIFAGFGGYGYY